MWHAWSIFEAEEEWILAREPAARQSSKLGTGLHLRSVELKQSAGSLPDRFPFSIRAVQVLERLEFATPVTFFGGENGSGNSTLLEGIATGG